MLQEDITNDKAWYSFIPNIVTLLNLFFGCMAIVACLQTNLVVNADASSGLATIELPEKMVMASVFIGIAAFVDFLDGFVARLLKSSSEMGKQLDSLADVVSFGVAPGMIVYQFLKLSYAHQEDGLDINTIWLLPAFVIPCAGAYRLGRFNIDTEQSYGFKGVPIPAAGLLIASFPLIYFFSHSPLVYTILYSKWFWYTIIALISFLMVSTYPMMALKFKQVSYKALLPFLIIGVVIIVVSLLAGWWSVPAAFFTYIILSFIHNK